MKYTAKQRRIYHLARYHRIKSKMHDYLGGHCVVCGADKNLHIHHKDPALKSFTLAAKWGRAWFTIVAELDKCELRCEEHHKLFHAAKHGTISGYRNLRCRCEPCRKAWNSACKKWKQSSRSKRLPPLGQGPTPPLKRQRSVRY